jgi:transposase InsO family protein
MIHQSRALFAALPVERICALLNLDRSGLYRVARPRSEVNKDNETALRDAIETIVVEFAGYGYRRVTAQLARDGWCVNHKRVLRIMQQESLLCQLRRRWVATTDTFTQRVDSDHGLRVYPNLLQGKKASEISGLNQVSCVTARWVADLTYIRLPSGFCYLAAVLDAFSRRVVGWHLSRFIDSDLSLVALGFQEIRWTPLCNKDNRPQALFTIPTEGFSTPAVSMSSD